MTFDFGKFASDTIKAIDSKRSQAKQITDISGTTEEPVESRINAFYRSLGLPAVTSEDIDLPFNNGNPHSITMTEELKNTFLQREQAFLRPINEEIVDNFLDVHKLKLSDSIKFNDTQGRQTPKRTRGSLFPMMVFGDFGIFPQDRRIAGPFFTQTQVIIDGIKYERPLLELIVLLRLKGDGVQDTVLQDQINEDFEASLGAGIVNATNLNIVTATIIRQLLTTILGIKDQVRKVLQDLSVIRTNVRTIFKDRRANIPDEQPIFKSSDLTGTVEIIRQQQQQEKNQREAVLALLEYDDTLSGGTEKTRNTKDAWLASSVIDLLTTESQRISISIEETDQKKEKIDRMLREQQRNMDLLLGTFSGLSGVDIIVVITALFAISQEAVLGLLNEDAFQRLKDIKGQGFDPARSSVGSAVSELEDKVTDIYDAVENIIGIRNIFESNQIQSGGV